MADRIAISSQSSEVKSKPKGVSRNPGNPLTPPEESVQHMSYHKSCTVSEKKWDTREHKASP